MSFTRDGLLQFHGWTHSVIDVLLEHAHSMPAAALTTPVEGFGRNTLREQFVHVLFTEATWIRALQSLEYHRWEDATQRLDQIASMKQEVAAATVAYLNSISEAGLNSELDRVPAYWVGPRRTPAFICHHVLTHAFHHKGQIAAMFRMLGYPLPDSDMQRQE